ncbi:hypothetical protein M1349_05645 [Patescibacteria group bacterium]|nr:hypothetical protein [Patescibacteria group bacterium]
MTDFRETFNKAKQGYQVSGAQQEQDGLRREQEQKQEKDRLVRKIDEGPKILESLVRRLGIREVLNEARMVAWGGKGEIVETPAKKVDTEKNRVDPNSSYHPPLSLPELFYSSSIWLGFSYDAYELGKEFVLEKKYGVMSHTESANQGSYTTSYDSPKGWHNVIVATKTVIEKRQKEISIRLGLDYYPVREICVVDIPGCVNKKFPQVGLTRDSRGLEGEGVELFEYHEYTMERSKIFIYAPTEENISLARQILETSLGIELAWQGQQGKTPQQILKVEGENLVKLRREEGKTVPEANTGFTPKRRLL